MTTKATQFVPQTMLSTTAVSLYTVPANVVAVIKDASVSNTSASSTVKLSIYNVSQSGSANATTQVTPGVAVAPNVVYPCAELINKVLPAGSQIYAKDDTGGVSTIELSGVLIS